MLEQLMIVTPVEATLGIFAVAVLVQLFIFRAQVNAAAAKNARAQFPGLSTALASIPARGKKQNR